MSKQRIPLECAECLNTCLIQSSQNESISFCPFCGEALVVEFSDDADELFSDIDDDTEDTDTDY
jgi:hypothetical protein